MGDSKSVFENSVGDCFTKKVRDDGIKSAPGEIRTPNRLIRSQVLYPLSYGGERQNYTACARICAPAVSPDCSSYKSRRKCWRTAGLPGRRSPARGGE